MSRFLCGDSDTDQYINQYANQYADTNIYVYTNRDQHGDPDAHGGARVIEDSRDDPRDHAANLHNLDLVRDRLPTP